MTAKPMKMHLDHAFDNEKWRRETYVNQKLRATRHVTKWTKEYSRDAYSTLPEMPFQVERLHFYKTAENDTQGRFSISLPDGGNLCAHCIEKSPRLPNHAEPSAKRDYPRLLRRIRHHQ